MELRTLSQLFSLRDLRNAMMGAVVVFGGIGLSGLTYYAHLTAVNGFDSYFLLPGLS